MRAVLRSGACASFVVPLPVCCVAFRLYVLLCVKKIIQSSYVPKGIDKVVMWHNGRTASLGE